MTEYRLSVEDDPSSDDLAAVSRGLEAYNVVQTGLDDARRLAIFLRDEAGQIVGGLCGWTWWGCCAIDELWIAEHARGREYGTRMIGLAEQEARARGCHQITLTTMSFQAPDFYRKLGYEEYAILDGFVGGHVRHYFRKSLHPG
jgi:ribosomal protein S18 acetylase RimI-like enzyme